MKKIGVFGGSFDPIHKIHIEIAEAAKIQYGLDKVLVVPAKYPPHKTEARLASDEDRFRMVQLACENLCGIEASAVEMERDSVSYTADTLSILAKRYPNAGLYFIVGGDSINYIEKWYRPDIIFRKARILYAIRNGDGREKILNHIENTLNPTFGFPQISEIIFKETDVSSSKIREEIANGRPESVKNCLNFEVYRYIMEKRLYHRL